MSETRGNEKGTLNLDVALRQWPDVEKPQEHWDDRAQLVMDRIEQGERGASAAFIGAANLLEAPLGQSPEDSHNSLAAGGAGSASHHPPTREGTPMTMPADRERDRRSLQDLAKMAQGLTPPPSSVAPAIPSGVQRAVEAKKDDSGIVDLAAASQADPSAAVRAQSTPLASEGLFDDEPANSQRPPMSAPAASGPVSHVPHAAPLGAQGLPAQPSPSVPPASLPPQALAPSAPAMDLAAPVQATALTASSAGGQKKKGSGAVIALVVAIGAVAAGGFFFMKSRSAAESTAAATVTTPEPAATVAMADPAPAKAEEAPAEPEEATAAAEPVAEPEELPTTASRIKIASASKTTKGAAAKHEAAAAAPKPEGPAKMTEKDLAAAPSGPAGDLGAAMKNVVGDDGTPKTPAAATTGVKAPVGNVPTKPSQGAVTGAIGAVLPGARACLGPDDPVSRAAVVFSSGGSVQSVNVSGHAAGKPAEACIKSALMKAQVSPFAEPTYTANITIRHN